MNSLPWECYIMTPQDNKNIWHEMLKTNCRCKEGTCWATHHNIQQKELEQTFGKPHGAVTAKVQFKANEKQEDQKVENVKKQKSTKSCPYKNSDQCPPDHVCPPQEDEVPPLDGAYED